MGIKKKKKKLTTKKIQRGTVGSFFVFGVLALLIVAGITVVGGLPTAAEPTDDTTQVNIVTPTQGPTKNTLQLETFGYTTIAPTSIPSTGSGLCQPGGANDEPQIIAATSPAQGQSVSTTSTIKVWVDDEGAPMIAPQETTNSDGSINTPGNQYAIAPDNYLFEPALYLDSATAESGGPPSFPSYIKGQVNNNPSQPIEGTSVPATVAIDPQPAGAQSGGCLNSFFFKNCFQSEYIWNVSSLNLSAGNHQAEFVIHDGDDNRGVGCINFTVQ